MDNNIVTIKNIRFIPVLILMNSKVMKFIELYE